MIEFFSHRIVSDDYLFLFLFKERETLCSKDKLFIMTKKQTYTTFSLSY